MLNDLCPRVLLTGVVLAGVAGCDGSSGTSPGGTPAPPRNLEAFYYERAVHLGWELHAAWDGEPFRVFGKRVADADYFLLAEVTSCSGGRCSYRDTNIVSEVSYDYYVASVGRTGQETPSAQSVRVAVPSFLPPPVPGGLEAAALDGAIFLSWDGRSRDADDFSFYRVYLDDPDGIFLLGETDSEGFLDLLVQNGTTYRYFVTAVDDGGHESEGSAVAAATPRPDFHGEFLYAFDHRPEASGFRFQESEATDPIVHGAATDRHFRLETDAEGWWVVPGPGAQLHAEAFFTSALRCGPGADAGCLDVREAPAANYVESGLALVPGFAYVLRVPVAEGGWQYGLIRVTHVGVAQGEAIAIFDWAFQLQPENRSLSPPR